jgi:hypothetical protein
MMAIGNDHIGFVIWGVRNGFNPDLLSDGLVPEVRNRLSDGMRQICLSLSDRFYGIERSSSHVLVTAYKPDAADHVGRKAYIAITLFIPLGKCFQGNVLWTLNRLLDYYEEKQGRETGNNRFSAGMFREQFAELGTAPYSGPHGHGDVLGAKSFSGPDEVEDHFKKPTIPGYRKVFFFRMTIPKFSGREVYQDFIPKEQRQIIPGDEVIWPISSSRPRNPPASTRKLAGLLTLALCGVIAGGIFLYNHLIQPTAPIQEESPVETLCDAPKNFKVVDTTETSARLTWDTVPGAVGYLIQHRAENDEWKKSRVDSNSTRFIGLVAGAKYEFQVAAICQRDTSNYGAVRFLTKTKTEKPNPIRYPGVIREGGPTKEVKPPKVKDEAACAEIKELEDMLRNTPNIRDNERERIAHKIQELGDKCN